MNKFSIFAACVMAVSFASCDNDEPEVPGKESFRTVTKAEEFISAMEEGVDIYVPEGQVIDMHDKKVPAFEQDMSICIDGEVKNVEGYIEVKNNISLSGTGRIGCTGMGGLYIQGRGSLSATDITIDFTIPKNSYYGCAIYINGGAVTFNNATITSTNQCVFSSQLTPGSTLTATNTKFLSTSTSYYGCYAIEAAGELQATLTNCDVSSFYGGVLAEAAKAAITLDQTRVAVFKHSNYTCQYALLADGGGQITTHSYTAFYSEGAHTAVQNNHLGAAGKLIIYEQCMSNSKAYDIPSKTVVALPSGEVWMSQSGTYTFLYPDGSTRQQEVPWISHALVVG